MAAVFRAAVGTRARPVFRSRTSCVCPYRSPQKLSFISARKCWKCSVIGIIFAIGCRSPFGKALACEAKANLHPLAFYTIEFTSPSPISPISPVQICHDLLMCDRYRLSRRKQIIVGALRQYLGRGRPDSSLQHRADPASAHHSSASEGPPPGVVAGPLGTHSLRLIGERCIWRSSDD